MLVFVAVAGSGDLGELFCVPNQHLGSLQPSSPVAAPTVPPVQTRTLLRAMGGHVQGLLWCTFSLVSWMWSQVPLKCVLSLVPGMCASEVRTLLGASDLGWMPPTPSREPWAARQRGGWSCCCRRIPQTAPECLFFFFFFFLRNSSCSILPPHTRKGLSSHSPTSPARPGTVRVRA